MTNKKTLKFGTGPGAILFVFALILLVVALVAFSVGQQSDQSDKSRYYRNNVHGHLNRRSHQIKDGTILFIGDSFVQSLSTSAIANNSENFGTGFDTSTDVLTRLENYQPLAQTSILVVHVGINDLLTDETHLLPGNIKQILMTHQGPIILSAIAPIHEVDAMDRYPQLSNEKIRVANRQLEELCLQGCQFTDVGVPLKKLDDIAAYYEADGLHLSTLGYALLIDCFAEAIGKVKDWKNS